MLKLKGEIIKIEKGGTGHPQLAPQWITDPSSFKSYRVVTIDFGCAGLLTLRLAWASSSKLCIGDAVNVAVKELAADSAATREPETSYAATTWVTSFDKAHKSLKLKEAKTNMARRAARDRRGKAVGR